MIRETLESEKMELLAIARRTNMFRGIEIDALGEVIDDYFKTGRADGHRAITFEHEGDPIGFAYYAPTPMTYGTWHLYWIFVETTLQAQGVGTRMLLQAENDVRDAGGRLLLIETSSVPWYDLTRKFYIKHGYDPIAVIKDFYKDGDDQVIYWKRMTG
jgi:GNAT superfamily N-acetyltransferase